MTIAIIGGSGFLGRNVALRLLAHGEKALVVHRGNEPANLPDAVAIAHADRMDEAALLDIFRQHDVRVVIDIYALSLGNTQAVIKLISDYAADKNVTVYTFDTKLDGGYARKIWGYERDLHIRDNNSEFANLYVDLVLNYFQNIETEYTLESGNTIHYDTAEGETITANKLQVPYLLVYTKGLEDEYAHFVPISAYIEKMLTLDETRDDYVYKEENLQAYTDGVAAVFAAYEALTGK